jgi:hypothetical protein
MNGLAPAGTGKPLISDEPSWSRAKSRDTEQTEPGMDQ